MCIRDRSNIPFKLQCPVKPRAGRGALVYMHPLANRVFCRNQGKWLSIQTYPFLWSPPRHTTWARVSGTGRWGVSVSAKASAAGRLSTDSKWLTVDYLPPLTSRDVGMLSPAVLCLWLPSLPWSFTGQVICGALFWGRVVSIFIQMLTWIGCGWGVLRQALFSGFFLRGCEGE